ncbi:MAG: hypothetical protein L6Q97_18115, partial [Thermoanaerobaculia bacterium]|nr:hypothetical protein [Thermoanaerobaculia bacterium]
MRGHCNPAYPVCKQTIGTADMKSPALYLLLPLIFPFCLAAPMQAQEKGVTPIISHLSSPKGTTRAVVVGISDYQDADIPDLKYAHKDAEAFANFLSRGLGSG